MNANELHMQKAHVHKLLCAKNPDAALLYLYINGGNDPAVEGAAKAYEQHLEKRKHFRNQLLSNHTIG